MKAKVISIIVLVVVAALITIILVRNKKKINEKNTPIDRTHIPVSVAVATVQMLPSNGDISLPAILQPNEVATIAVAAMGKLESLSIELGSKVHKGQIIGRVDTRTQQIQLHANELTVAKLKSDYERNQALLEGNAISATNVRDSKYNYETNKLALDQLRQQISDANIIAPISGVITEKKLLPGEFVSAGMPIASVVDVSQLKTVIFVSESDVYYLKLKQKVSVSSRLFPEKVLDGNITYVSPNGDNNHKYKVEVTLSKANDDFKAGTYVNVICHLGIDKDVLQIPKLALVNGIKDPFVFLVVGTKVEKRKVVLGREIEENYELVSGLKEGDKIVTDGKINLINGSNIETQK